MDESMKARWAEEIARIPAGLQVVNSVGKVVNVTAETFCSKPPLDLPLFFLYTRKNLNHSEQLFMGNSSFGSFNSSNPTRFITHGWVNGEESLSVTSIRHGESRDCTRFSFFVLILNQISVLRSFLGH